MNYQVLIQKVSSYDLAELIPAVNAVFQQWPEVIDYLKEANPSRLVVIKPNWIQESHQEKGEVWEPVITHPNLLMSIVEIVAGMMQGKGTICLCDAPNTDAQFDRIIARGNLTNQFARLAKRFPELRLEIVDLRREVWITREDVVVERKPNAADPRGYVKYELNENSLFVGHSGEGNYYGADYDSKVVNQHHHGHTHEYLLAGTPAKCDLFINVPKLKTHRKTGITCSLKNLVGINGDKNWLPHFVEGTPRMGGDEFADDTFPRRMERLLKKSGQQLAFKFPGLGSWLYRKIRLTGKELLGNSEKTIRAGNWVGNDTCWRMALDLNRLLIYGKSDGTLSGEGPTHKYITIVDGIVGGEGNGPLSPDPVQSNLLISGTDPAPVDAVACRLMGYDPRQIPIVSHAFDRHVFPIAQTPLDSILVQDQRIQAIVKGSEVKSAVNRPFRLHKGWASLMSKRS